MRGESWVFLLLQKMWQISIYIYIYLHKYIRYQDIFHRVKPKPLRTSTRRQDSCGVGMVADLTGAGHG